jgi:hypothetical protein
MQKLTTGTVLKQTKTIVNKLAIEIKKMNRLTHSPTKTAPDYFN